jgi:hypothetical protein
LTHTFEQQGVRPYVNAIQQCPLSTLPNPVKHLDHAKREVIAGRHYDITANAIEFAAQKGT